MEVDLTSFINNKEFYKKLLEKIFSLTNVIIKTTNLTNGCSGGDNYCSLLYRVNITYITDKIDSQTNEISLIIKCIESNSKGTGIAAELNVFEKEKLMYLNVIPEIEKYINQKNIMLTPKCLYATSEPVKILVFEDLVKMNYKLGNRMIGLDENHTKFVLMKIAQFHAGSMVFADKNPQIIKKLDYGIIKPNSGTERRKKMYYLFFEWLANSSEQLEGCEKIGSKIRHIVKNIMERFYRTVDTKYDKIRVINHGDLWVNNVMFKYNETGIENLAFIDLQLSYYASMGLDINYLFTTSVQVDILKTKREELIKYYYLCLKDDLQKLNYKSIPTLKDIQQEIHNKEFFGVYAMAITFPLIIMNQEVSKDNDLKMFVDKDYVQHKLDQNLKSKRYVETIKYLLNRYNDLGLFEPGEN